LSWLLCQPSEPAGIVASMYVRLCAGKGWL